MKLLSGKLSTASSIKENLAVLRAKMIPELSRA